VIELLAKVNPPALKNEILKIPLVSEFASLTRLTAARELATFLVAYYGTDLLDIPSMRQVLFSLLPLKNLNELCRGLGLPESRFVYDAALILSTAPWTHTSPLPNQICAQFLRSLGQPIPDEFMPTEPTPRPPTIEEIYSEALSPLFDYQRQMSDAVAGLLSSSSKRAMLQMPTGSGKTRTVMHALVRWMSNQNQKTDGLVLWMAHSEELCDQAIESFKRSWLEYGEGKARVYRLWGAQKFPQEKLSTGIVVASLQKLHSLRIRKDPVYEKLVASAHAVIFDEAHKSLAPTYKGLIEGLTKAGRKKVLLGLSATPGRGVLEAIANERLAEIFDNHLIFPQFGDKDAITALRELGVLAKIQRKVINNPKAYELNYDERRFIGEFFEFPQSLLDRLGRDENRNLLVAAEVIQQVKQKRQCIVFACSVEHAKLLSAIIGMQGASSCSVTSNMRYANRVRSIEGFRKQQFAVIVNYGILTTGFDAPNVGAVIIARPTASIVLYSQMIGRGLRGPKVGGKEECVVVDVMDNVEGFGSEAEVYDYFKDYWH